MTAKPSKTRRILKQKPQKDIMNGALPKKIALDNIPETNDPLNQSGEIAGEASVLADTVGPKMKVFPAQWRSGKWQMFGIAIQSSTGEIVTRIPRYKRLRDRNKYDSRGRLKSKLSESESPETPSR